MKINKVIILDDDLEYTNEIEELLVQNNFEVVKKNDTDDILNFVKLNKPDLIILDLKINGLTGVDVTKILKKDFMTKELPIMMLTNYYNSSDYKNNKIKSGINICLKKTIKPDDLIKEIKIIESGLKMNKINN